MFAFILRVVVLYVVDLGLVMLIIAKNVQLWKRIGTDVQKLSIWDALKPTCFMKERNTALRKHDILIYFSFYKFIVFDLFFYYSVSKTNAYFKCFKLILDTQLIRRNDQGTLLQTSRQQYEVV
jgi:hypothetical protein